MLQSGTCSAVRPPPMQFLFTSSSTAPGIGAAWSVVFCALSSANTSSGCLFIESRRRGISDAYPRVQGQGLSCAPRQPLRPLRPAAPASGPTTLKRLFPNHVRPWFVAKL